MKQKGFPSENIEKVVKEQQKHQIHVEKLPLVMDFDNLSINYEEEEANNTKFHDINSNKVANKQNTFKIVNKNVINDKSTIYNVSHEHDANLLGTSLNITISL